MCIYLYNGQNVCMFLYNGQSLCIYLYNGQSYICITFSAGIGRTGTYIALDILSQEGQTEQAIDVPRCVRTIRQYRTNLVQTVVCGQCDVFWCIRFGKVTCCMSNINRMQWCICFIGHLNTVLPLNSVNNNWTLFEKAHTQKNFIWKMAIYLINFMCNNFIEHI